MRRNYARCFTAATNNPTHPTIKQSPPKGVTGPRNRHPSIPNKERTLSKYKDPENNSMPMVKAMNETRIDGLLALEKVERNNNAKT